MKIVISQPMFFPWVGFLEQIRLADVYVYYDDVQFSKGSFTNRVQIKTPDGFTWLTVPLHNLKLGQKIMEVQIDNSKDWRSRHQELLTRQYATAPFVKDMLDIVRRVYEIKTDMLIDLTIGSMKEVLEYYSMLANVQFIFSSKMKIPGQGSSRVLEIVKSLGGTEYITGHGAKNYLQHENFEVQGIRVEYVKYKKKEYPQLHGAFNPYVSALDLIANVGHAGAAMICSETLYWKEFLANEQN
jgi:hypothetical protein